MRELDTIESEPEPYTCIYKFMISNLRIYEYIRVQNNLEKMHNYRILTDDHVHTIHKSGH